MENTKMEVKINNMEYTVVSNESEEYVQRVALLVNKKISEVKNNNGLLSTAMLAVMAAMNLADELIKSNEAADKLRGEINAYTEAAQSASEELEAKKLEVENLKEDLHKLEIRLAKRETELENLRGMQSHASSAPAQTAPSQSAARQDSRSYRSADAPIKEMQTKYGSNVISRGVPKNQSKF